MHLIYDNGTSKTQIWGHQEGESWEFYIHGSNKNGDPQTCRSFDRACELARIDPAPILALAPFLADK